jgi:hypothetical protein
MGESVPREKEREGARNKNLGFEMGGRFDQKKLKYSLSVPPKSGSHGGQSFVICQTELLFLCFNKKVCVFVRRAVNRMRNNLTGNINNEISFMFDVSII